MPPIAHQPEPDEGHTFVLGKPTNRTEPSELTPISGRPNWWKDRKGNEKYIEPPAPPVDIPCMQIDDMAGCCIVFDEDPDNLRYFSLP